MSNQTNRLEEIAQRSRTRRTRDLAFAILLAFVVFFQITALHSAVAETQQLVKAKTVVAAPAQLDAGSATCSVEPVC